MKKTIFLISALLLFSGCDGLNSAKCPSISSYKNKIKYTLEITAKDDIAIKNIIVNRGNCLYPSPDGSYFINGVNEVQGQIGGLLPTGESLSKENIENNKNEILENNKKFYDEAVKRIKSEEENEIQEKQEKLDENYNSALNRIKKEEEEISKLKIELANMPTSHEAELSQTDERFKKLEKRYQDELEKIKELSKNGIFGTEYATERAKRDYARDKVYLENIKNGIIKVYEKKTAELKEKIAYRKNKVQNWTKEASDNYKKAIEDEIGRIKKRAKMDIDRQTNTLNKKNKEAQERADRLTKYLKSGGKVLNDVALKFGDTRRLDIYCQPLEVVFETNLGKCEYSFDK